LGKSASRVQAAAVPPSATIPAHSTSAALGGHASFPNSSAPHAVRGSESDSGRLSACRRIRSGHRSNLDQSADERQPAKRGTGALAERLAAPLSFAGILEEGDARRGEGVGVSERDEGPSFAEDLGGDRRVVGDHRQPRRHVVEPVPASIRRNPLDQSEGGAGQYPPALQGRYLLGSRLRDCRPNLSPFLIASRPRRPIPVGGRHCL
jgi:hypothetical protein